MTAIAYQDFDLSIELTSSEPPRYRARVSSLAAGQASSEFTLPFSNQDLEILFLRLGRPRRGVRAIGSPEMQAAQTFGSTLFSHVFTGQVQSCLQRSLDHARQQGQGLRIRLRLSDAADLADLPWEFLYDSTQSHFLAYSTVTPLVRYLDLPQTVAPLAVQPPLKVLVMIANPRDPGFSTLDVEEEWRKVQGALADLEGRGLVQVTRLGGPLGAATLSALQRQLRRDQYHIFHFVGHGGFDNQSQSGVLLLEDEGGRSRLVSGHYLGALLRDHFSLRLALLNACEGARTSRSDPFAGVAQHLVQQGIPAVIAMQFEITDGAAITLSHEFYNALADNYGVDAALAEARKALYAAGNDIEWGTPVLYMRAQSGQLFALTAIESVRKDAEAQREAAGSFGASRKVEPQSSTQRWRRPGLFAGLLTVLIVLGALSQYKPIADGVSALLGGAVPPTATLTVTAVSSSPTQPPAIALATETAAPPSTAMIRPTPGAVATHTPQPPATAPTSPRVTDAHLPPTLTDTVTSVPFPTDTATVTSQPTSTPTPQLTPTPTLGIGATRTVLLSSGVNITFVYVPGGDFLMGSVEAQVDEAVLLCNRYYGDGDDCQRNGYTDELEQHTVSVEPFWIMKTEVTNMHYRTFIASGSYDRQVFWSESGWQWRQENQDINQPRFWDDVRFNSDEQPVVGISWYEATAFAKWLSEETELTIRLPTEAEWEKAARGLDGLTFPWGNEWDGKRANYCDKNCDQIWKDETVDDGYAYTAPVDSYPNGASTYGALSMAGNVREWTSSRDMAYPYKIDDGREDPIGTALRVVRGGSWGNFPNYLRTAYRSRRTPGDSFNYLGFRVVVVVP